MSHQSDSGVEEQSFIQPLYLPVKLNIIFLILKCTCFRPFSIFSFLINYYFHYYYFYYYYYYYYYYYQYYYYYCCCYYYYYFSHYCFYYHYYYYHYFHYYHYYHHHHHYYYYYYHYHYFYHHYYCSSLFSCSPDVLDRCVFEPLYFESSLSLGSKNLRGVFTGCEILPVVLLFGVDLVTSYYNYYCCY